MISSLAYIARCDVWNSRDDMGSYLELELEDAADANESEKMSGSLRVSSESGMDIGSDIAEIAAPFPLARSAASSVMPTSGEGSSKWRAA